MNRPTSGFHALLLAGVWGAVAAAPTHAQTRTVTLETLEQHALASRQSLSAQQARMRRAAAEVERRQSASNPSITLGTDVSLSPGGTLERLRVVDLDPAHDVLVQGVRAFGDPDALAAQARYGATLAISKNLFDFGRTARAVDAARAEQAAASADDRAARRQMLDEVRAAYLAWLGATEVAAISEQAVADAQVRYKFVADLVAEGAKPAADVLPVASDEALARLEVSRARAEVEQARILLDAAIGGGLPADAEPDRRVLQVNLPAPDTVGGIPGSSTDAAVDALERQRDAARATATMYDHLRSPVIGAEAQLGVRAQNPISGGGRSGVFPMYRLGLSVSVPLSDGGSASANANVARAQADEFAARSRELSLARQTARSQAEAEAAAAQARLGIAREVLALSERRTQDAQERYELAGGGVEAIADANAMRRRARTEIVLAQIAAARARYALLGQ